MVIFDSIFKYDSSFIDIRSLLQYLACLSSSSSNDKLSFDVGLQEQCHGEACWWTVHPASKQRSEGEKVRVGDDLILVSVATERYLVRFIMVLSKKKNYITSTVFIAHHKRKRFVRGKRKFPCNSLVRPTIWYRYIQSKIRRFRLRWRCIEVFPWWRRMLDHTEHVD
jgi:hypothetical protein